MNFQLQSQSAWQWHHPQKQQSRIAGASHKIAQRARSTDNGATPISSVLIFFSRYRALDTVSCAFTGLIFQNRFETISFLTFWTANREITTSCAFLQLFLRSTFLWRPLGPPYLQKQWFVHFDFSHTNAHARGLFLYVSVIYSFPLPTAIADSVVDMIPKLTMDVRLELGRPRKLAN